MQTAGYSYEDMSSPVSPSPPSTFPYFSEALEPLKDGFQYSSPHMGMDFAVFLQPTYTA
jgi:hypothetical protein